MYTTQEGEDGGYALFHDGILIDTYETREEAQDVAEGLNKPSIMSHLEWLNK